jgi:hypothetical protein
VEGPQPLCALTTLSPWLSNPRTTPCVPPDSDEMEEASPVHSACIVSKAPPGR